MKKTKPAKQPKPKPAHRAHVPSPHPGKQPKPEKSIQDEYAEACEKLRPQKRKVSGDEARLRFIEEAGHVS